MPIMWRIPTWGPSGSSHSLGAHQRKSLFSSVYFLPPPSLLPSQCSLHLWAGATMLTRKEDGPGHRVPGCPPCASQVPHTHSLSQLDQ